MHRPQTLDEASALLRGLDGAVRPRGGGTKLGWGPAGEAATDLDTRAMARILEHNVGDFTAILEAGVPLLEAQAAFAAEGQMLALDPPLGADDAATIGGVVAANDSGPLRHRYGGVRDLVVGITVVLSDGTVARSGGKVIKNVAGYDLGKLFAGSSGTLGLIARLAVRLHPAPQATATAVASGDDPARLAAAAATLSHLPLEADALDVSWAEGSGRVLARFSGATAADRAPRRPGGSRAWRSRPSRPTTSCGHATARASARRTGSWSRCPGGRPTCRRCWKPRAAKPPQSSAAPRSGSRG